jgi:hypothetical protein
LVAIVARILMVLDLNGFGLCNIHNFFIFLNIFDLVLEMGDDVDILFLLVLKIV